MRACRSVSKSTKTAGGIGAPRIRMHEDLADEGERVSVNRVARLMPTQACRAGCGGASAASGGKPGARLSGVTNLLEREFSTNEPETKW